MSKPKRTPAQHHKDHDIFVRGILSLIQLVEKLLRFALDKDVLKYLDFSTLKSISDTHIDKRLRISYSDSMHECQLKRESLPKPYRDLPNLPRFRFVFLWESKSQKEPLPIDFQIGGYDDNLRRRDFIKKKKEENIPLSIVVPILIYHGKEEWKNKRLYDYFKPYLPDELMVFIPHDRLIVIDIQAMSEVDIENAIGLKELRSAFIALKHGHEKKYFKQNMKNVLKFVKEIPTKELLDMYLEMLYEYMQRRSGMDNEEFTEIVEHSNNEDMASAYQFKTIFETAREQGMETGLKEGLEKGMEKGMEMMRRAIKAMILTTQMNDTEIAEMLETNIDFVIKIRKELQTDNTQAKILKKK